MDASILTGPGLLRSISDSLFPDPSKGAMPYLEGIPDEMKGYLNPYIQQGQRAGTDLEGRYGSMLNDPGSIINNIGGGYQQSPGFKFALQQALQGAGHAAAAGGMAGSPEHEQQNMGLATNLANQDYGNWMDRAMGLYGKGLSGEEGMYNAGYNASNSLAESIAQARMAQANLRYAGGANQNQQFGGLLGNAASIAGAFI